MAYCDRRLYGVERWSMEPPEGANLWIPPDMAKAVCFLCVQRKGEWRYVGTAFFVSHQEKGFPDLRWDYLVTAKHCVTKAFSEFGNLSCRLNVIGGGVKFVSLPDLNSPNWQVASEDDVAVFAPPEDDLIADVLALPSETFVTDELIKAKGIGLGDEIFMLGLFHLARGRDKNFPIMRSGMIASMPDEPFYDKDTGASYRAFLIEARSIGGLSGSPVLMALRDRGVMHPPPRGYNPWIHSLLLFGLIRGHWDMDDKDTLPDFGAGTMEKLNTGIAIVTPIQEVTKILMNDELVTMRKADIRKREAEQAPTLDSGIEAEEPFTAEQFEADLRRVTRRVGPSAPDKETK